LERAGALVDRARESQRLPVTEAQQSPEQTILSDEKN
jgi:hypothetical protein